MRCDCGAIHTTAVDVAPRMTKAEATERLRGLLSGGLRPVTGFTNRVEITAKGRDELARSQGYEPNPLAFFRQRQAIAGRCTMAEQVAFMRSHRFRDAK